MRVVLCAKYIEGDTFNASLNEALIEKMKEGEGGNLELVLKFSFRGLMNYLKNEPNPDAIIIQEFLEGNLPIDHTHLNKINEESPVSSIIFIISNDRKNNTEYLYSFYQNKFYNVLFEEDSTVDNIIKLLFNKRSPRAAKAYLDINDDVLLESSEGNFISEHLFGVILERLYSSLTMEELHTNYEEIIYKFSETQNIFLAKSLPLDLSEKLQENTSFLRFINKKQEVDGIKDNIQMQEVIKNIDTNKKSNLFDKFNIFDKAPRNDIEPRIIKKTETILKEKILGTIFIGVGSVSGGMGATHLSLAIASYLNNRKLKTAVVEFNNSPSLRNISSNKKALFINKGDAIEYKGLDIYFQMTNKCPDINTVFREINISDYKYIVFDMGTLKELEGHKNIKLTNSYHEMWRMHHQILCLGGRPWQWPEINLYRYDDLEPHIEDWHLVLNFAHDSDFKKVSKEISNVTALESIYKSPLYIDPFDKSGSESFLNELLGDIIPASSEVKKRRNPLTLLKWFN